MNILFHKIASGILTLSLAVAGLFGYQAPHVVAPASITPTETVLGAAIPKGAASFQTSLASGIQTTDTSMTLVSTVTKDGTSLVAGQLYGFVIDQGTSLEEFVSGIASTSNTIVSMSRGLSVFSGTTTVSASQKRHNRGASVKSTDAPLILVISEILNGNDTIPHVLRYDASVTSTTIATNNNNLVNVDLLNNTAFSGSPNNSETVKGISELATGAEAALGTSVGGTGARLVIPSSLASSSCDIATNINLITQASGKVKQNCLDLSVPFTFASNVTITGSSTHTGTTSLPATAANPLVIRGVSYVFPAADGTSGYGLSTNGAGTLSWANLSNKIFATSTQATYTGDTSAHVVVTAAIPGGTLGTNNAIKFCGNFAFANKANTNTETILVKYGATTLSTTVLTSNDSSDAGYSVCGRIYGDGSTSAQELRGIVATENAHLTNDENTMIGGTAAIDSTASQNLTITLTANNTANQQIIYDFLVEQVR